MRACAHECVCVRAREYAHVRAHMNARMRGDFRRFETVAEAGFWCTTKSESSVSPSSSHPIWSDHCISSLRFKCKDCRWIFEHARMQHNAHPAQHAHDVFCGMECFVSECRANAQLKPNCPFHDTVVPVRSVLRNHRPPLVECAAASQF